MGGKLRVSPGTQVRIDMLMVGRNLFTEARSECLHDPDTPGFLSRDVTADANGAVALNATLAEFSSAVDTTCAMNRLVWPSTLSHLNIMVSVPADEASCSAYCGAQPASTTDCQSQCTTGTRRISWGTTLHQEELFTLSQRSIGGVGSLRLGPDLNNLGEPVSQTGNLPDLTVDAAAAASSVKFTTESFAANDCAVQEGCVVAGNRRLLRFSGAFMNVGSGDFVLGSPVNNPSFHYSECHKHFHLQGMMLYELLIPGTNTPVASAEGRAIGHKQGFCIEDGFKIAGFGNQKYDCKNQGLSSGWEDYYDGALDCQWVDITGVNPGQYILRISVNPKGLYPEADTTNNTAEIPVTIPAQ